MNETVTTAPGAKRSWPFWLGVFLLAVVGLMLFRDPTHKRLHAPARKEWKETAVANIERRLADEAWRKKESAVIKTRLEAEGEDEGGWFTTDLLALKNGDWIAYAAKCSKEDSRIHDIFIGRASDGKWYYSTFHFCIGMLDLRMDGRTASLAKFITAYSLFEFDGSSDDCLKQTWPNLTP